MIQTDGQRPTAKEYARRGRMIEAINAYREAHGVNLGEAKSAVERWVAINMPPSPDFQRCCAISDRVADRLARSASESGLALSFCVEILPPNAAAVYGHQPVRHTVVQCAGDRFDLAVIAVMGGTSAADRRAAVRGHVESGCRVVWVIDPEEASVIIQRHDQPLEARLLLDGATLDGGDVLPGFACPVADLFA